MDMNGEFSVGAEEEAEMETPQVCPEKTLEDCSVDLADEGTGRVMYVKGPKITRGDSAGTSARNGWSTGGTESIPEPTRAGIPERVPRRIPQVCPEDEGREASESVPEEEAAEKFPRDGRRSTPRGDQETLPAAASGAAAAAASAGKDPAGGPSPAPAPGTGDADATKPCGNCRHLIAVSNLSLHETHCFRNLLVCKRCDERVPRAEMEEHVQSEHTEVRCKCGKALEKCKLEDHLVHECPRQAAVCRYCGLEQPRATTREHEDFCGARTERCDACLVYVQKQDEEVHRVTCPGHPVAPDPAGTATVTEAANAALAAAMSALHDDPEVMAEYKKYLELLDSDDDEEEGSPASGSSFASSLWETAAQLTTAALLSSMQGGGGAEEEEEEGEEGGEEGGEEDTQLLEDDQELLPCEFCFKPVPAHELVLHQSGCNPTVAHGRVRYLNGVPTSGPPPPPPPPPPAAATAAAAQPLDEQLPCQYCYEPVTASLLQAHQDRCLKEQASAFARLCNQQPALAPNKEEPEPLDIGVAAGAATPVADEEMTEMAPSSSSAAGWWPRLLAMWQAKSSRAGSRPPWRRSGEIASRADVKEMETSAPLEDPGSAF
ncbi:uncharacterized protein LOC116950305 [Petromyzon marinus]|uniref:uncharacterized protein LOC116950305 n=1 Tax=Petromyzon marinus TaxID=7757 RepID=UPI003F708AF7